MDQVVWSSTCTTASLGHVSREAVARIRPCTQVRVPRVTSQFLIDHTRKKEDLKEVMEQYTSVYPNPNS